MCPAPRTSGRSRGISCSPNMYVLLRASRESSHLGPLGRPGCARALQEATAGEVSLVPFHKRAARGCGRQSDGSKVTQVVPRPSELSSPEATLCADPVGGRGPAPALGSPTATLAFYSAVGNCQHEGAAGPAPRPCQAPRLALRAGGGAGAPSQRDGVSPRRSRFLLPVAGRPQLPVRG